ncbi:MAG: ABC transporter ATP-binding protein [Lentisphaeria bacterium]|nr:ABC transporter ATP-binding protein [Lentisphaeria bacterium]
MAKSSITSLWRLFRTFGRPYWGRMLVGVLSGLLVGGSVFGILRSSITLFLPFDGLQFPGLERVTRNRGPEPETRPPPAAPAPAAASRDGDQPDAGSRRLDKILDWARRLGLEPGDGATAIDLRFMLLAVAGLLGFVLLRSFGAFLNNYCLRWVGARMVVDLRNALLEALHRQSLSYFGRKHIGQLISRCTYDTARIEGAVASTIADLTEAPFVLLGAILFAVDYAKDSELGTTVLLFGVVVPLTMGPVIVLGRWVKQYSRRALRRVSVLVAHFEENLSCIRIVKAFNTEAYEQGRFRDDSETYFHNVVRAIAVEVLMGPLMEFTAALTLCLFFLACYLRGIPMSQIFPMALAGYFTYKPLKQFAKINAAIQRTAAAIERVQDVLHTDTSLPLAAHPIHLHAFRERIVFDHVDFRYDAGGNPVLHDICLDVSKGSVVAFVGETGSGKTTIVNLLARFYDPTAGKILVDGHDLRDLDVTDLRRLIGVVTQETILFNDTVAHNIAYGSPEATAADIEAAARKANAHDFIVAEPQGYERMVGDKGMLLSGGQRQRIAIARAILKNPPILILDEATSALDTATELLVQEAINRVMADRTVFAIAHRLSTIRHADMICVLEAGRIAERGTHAALYKANGHYRRLCDLQFADAPGVRKG